MQKRVCPTCKGKKFQETDEQCVTTCREGMLYDSAKHSYSKPCPYRAKFLEYSMAYRDMSKWPDEKFCNGSGRLVCVCWRCKGKGSI